MDELLGAFVADCRERLAALESELSRLARQPDDTSLLASVFRGVHTIKGTCGFLGLNRLHHITQSIEDVLCRLRSGQLAANRPVITLMFETLYRITAILDELDRTGLEPDHNDRSLIAALEALATGAADDDPSATPVATAWPAEPAPSDDLAPSACLSQLEEICVERIAAAWSQLPRLVRHLAIELDKPMDLEMHGAEIEIDRRLIEPIKASLVHLVRNAADHGLEGRPERRRRGKREKGRIAVKAYRKADHVMIEVSDDGRGLDTEQITKAAVTSRLVGLADIATMTTADCQRLIFQPGFSTAKAVTPVSGRGVGLDAVRDDIERMGGTIEVCSIPGRGSVFTLQLPLTPAKAAAGLARDDEEGRASMGSNAVDVGSTDQRTGVRNAKRTVACRRRHPCRPAAIAHSGRKSVVPAPHG